MSGQTPTNDTADSSPICPVGESQCGVIDEVVALRGEVATLSEQVRTDTLTGLFNFRHFRQALDQEMERTRRTMQSTALVMVDLDYFKKVNDSWGHEVGNQALVSTAQLLRSTTRRLDIPCRYGGEEFAVILPATDLMTGIQVAERIRAAIETTPVMVNGEDIGLTASLGVEIYSALKEDTPEQLIERADRCLYKAKQQGRNQVCHGTFDMGQSEAAVSEEERDALSDFFGDDRADEE
ncbi:GGDEF domain-containing protein [Oceanicoccus sagamiensis]|uniref:diguanylate cyclase n=1 Tax=Oceanicoccus sagamiensis TaxID=716816 RepID=A0A1X9N9U4_9GAMM|nr:GGDEF domain-containing protein [Oceanicoccus sagamiensis]ARN73951.1 GGDEF domain-containing protein [Oceanicoccus sagamiensis]